MEEVNNQTPMENTPVENTQVITDLQPPIIEKKKNILIPILLIVVLILLSILAYLFFTDKIDIGIKNPFSKEEVVEEEKDGEEEGDVEEEQTQEEVKEDESIVLSNEYYNEEFGVRYNYPDSWIVDDSNSTCDNGVCSSLYLEIKDKEESPEFIYTHYIPFGSGPDRCFYSDTPGGMPTNEPQATYFDNFVDISSEEYTYRRSLNTLINSYTVCVKGDSGIFSNWINPGYVTYKVNMENDNAEEMLDIMDNILHSFEYTGEGY